MACDPALQVTVSFAASGVTTYTCKKPDFGNTLDKDLRLIVHRTRGSLLYIYKRGDEIDSITLPFKAFKKDEKDAFEAFVVASRGKLITYTDHFNVAHTGFISRWSWVEEGNSHGFDIDVGFEFE